MNCPICGSEDLVIEEKELVGNGFTAPVWYASCFALLEDDPNWGGGYDCEFFIVRESEDLILKEIERQSQQKVKVLDDDACPYCKGIGKGKMSGVEVGCLFCKKTGSKSTP